MNDNLRAWAIKGAEQRLVEIAEEAKSIFSAFPELRAAEAKFQLSKRKGGAPDEGARRAEPTLRPRRTMSAAARKRIGDAQRKRWAAQRQKEATTPATAKADAPPPQRMPGGRRNARKSAKAA